MFAELVKSLPDSARAWMRVLIFLCKSLSDMWYGGWGVSSDDKCDNICHEDYLNL